MAESLGTVGVDVVIDKNQVGREADRAGRLFGTGWQSTLAKVGAVTAGVTAVVVPAVKGVLDAAEESRRVQKQTEAVIKSTGGAANLTADQFANLAEKISKTTGVDDEAIQSAENILATFTNVKDLGNGKDIFSAATQLATDMAAALGGDATQSAMDIGKALNDPIKGIGRLQRVGVTFTDQQKDQIKAMQDAGDVAGAQKIILDELAREFGGSAKAQATAGKKLSVAWGNVQEDIGKKLLPIFDRVATWLVEKGPKAVDAFLKKIRPFTDAIANFVKKDPVPFLAGIAAVVGVVLAGAFWTLATAVLAATWPFLLLIAVVAGIVYAYRHVEGFRKVVDAVARFIKEKAIPAIVTAFEWVADKVGAVVDWIKEIWPQVSEAVGHVVNVVSDIVGGFIDTFQKAWSLFGDNILGVAKAVWGTISTVVESAINFVKNIIALVLAVINGDWGKAWDAIKGALAAVWDAIFGIVKGALLIVKELIKGGIDVVKGAWDTAWGAIKDGFGALWNGITGVFEGVFNSILGVLETGINKSIDLINGAITLYNKIPFAPDFGLIGHVHIPRLGGNGAPSVTQVGGQHSPPLSGPDTAGAGGGGKSGAPVTIIAYNADPVQVAREVAWAVPA